MVEAVRASLTPPVRAPIVNGAITGGNIGQPASSPYLLNEAALPGNVITQ
jgi:hypothetical protein